MDRDRAAAMRQDIDRYLTLLRNLIRQQGFTQLEVQEELDWGRSYISQLMTGAKVLRFDQVLDILNVIGVSFEDFFVELYHIGSGVATAAPAMPQELRMELDRMRTLLEGALSLLAEKGVVEATEVAALLAADLDPARRSPDEP